MSASPLQALHKALFQKMHTHTPLIGAVTGVYDRVVTGVAFPYVAIEDSTLTRWNSIGRTGYQFRIELGVYSRQGGRKELTQLIDILYALLHQQSLTVAGFNVSEMVLSHVDTQKEGDGITTSARVTVQCWVQENGI